MRMVRSCWAGVLVGIFDAVFTSSSLILSVSWATRDLRYASSSEAEVIGDVLVGMLVDGKRGLAFDNSNAYTKSPGHHRPDSVRKDRAFHVRSQVQRSA